MAPLARLHDDVGVVADVQDRRRARAHLERERAAVARVEQPQDVEGLLGRRLRVEALHGGDGRREPRVLVLDRRGLVGEAQRLRLFLEDLSDIFHEQRLLLERRLAVGCRVEGGACLG